MIWTDLMTLGLTMVWPMRPGWAHTCLTIQLSALIFSSDNIRLTFSRFLAAHHRVSGVTAAPLDFTVRNPGPFTISVKMVPVKIVKILTLGRLDSSRGRNLRARGFLMTIGISCTFIGSRAANLEIIQPFNLWIFVYLVKNLVNFIVETKLTPWIFSLAADRICIWQESVVKFSDNLIQHVQTPRYVGAENTESFNIIIIADVRYFNDAGIIYSWNVSSSLPPLSTPYLAPWLGQDRSVYANYKSADLHWEAAWDCK